MLSQLLKRASAFSFASLLIILSSLISFPVLTRVFSVEDYGTISLINALITFLSAFSKGGLQNSVVRFYNDAKVEARLGNFFSTALLGMLLSSLLVVSMVVMVYVLSESVNNYLSSNYAMTVSLLLVIAGLIVARSAQSSLLNCFLIMEHSAAYATFQVYGKYLVLGAILIAVLLIGASVSNFFVAMLVGEVLALILIARAFKARQATPIRANAFDPEMFKAMLAYSLPMVGYEVTTIIHTLADRVVLDLLMDKEAVGLYSAAYNVAELFNVLVAVSVSSVIQPAYFKLWANDGEEATVEFLNTALYYYIILLPAVVWGVVAIGGDLLVLLASDKYAPGAVIFPFIITGIMINATAFIYAAGLYIYKRSMQLFVPALICSVINIGLNFLLIPSFGIRGAAAATLVSLCLVSAMMFFSGRALLKLHFSISHLLKYALAASFMGIVVQQIALGSPLLNILSKVGCGAFLYALLVLIIDSRCRSLFLQTFGGRSEPS